MSNPQENRETDAAQLDDSASKSAAESAAPAGETHPAPGTEQFVPGLGKVTVGDPHAAPASHSAEDSAYGNGIAVDIDPTETPNPASDSKPTEGESETRTETEASSEETMGDPLTAEFAEAQEARINELKDELARANAAYYNLDQEYSAYVRRTKAEIPTHRQSGIAAVVNALMGVLDDIALARQHEDLTGPFQAVAQKLEDTLESKFQVIRYGQVGQAFDPELHQAIQMMDGEGEETVIVQVAQPGYLQGDKVLRPAMVIAGTGQVTVPATELPGGEKPAKEAK